jgi:hypothetical protein
MTYQSHCDFVHLITCSLYAVKLLIVSHCNDTRVDFLHHDIMTWSVYSNSSTKTLKLHDTGYSNYDSMNMLVKSEQN